MEGMVPAAAALAVVIVLVMVFAGMAFRRKHGSLLESDRIIEEAERNGWTAEGRLLNEAFLRREIGNKWGKKRRDHWNAKYEYYVGQQRYLYERVCYDLPPERITLYYDPRRPGRAVSRGDREPGKPFFLLWAFAVVLMAILIRLVFRA